MPNTACFAWEMWSISDWKAIFIIMMCLRLPLICLQDLYWITEQDRKIKKMRISQNPMKFFRKDPEVADLRKGQLNHWYSPSRLESFKAFPYSLEGFSGYPGSMELNDSYRSTVLLKFIRFFPMRIQDLFYSAQVHSELPFLISQTHTYTPTKRPPKNI